MTHEALIQDPFNGSKQWVVRKTDTGYEWNQLIDGYQFYADFAPVTEDWMVQVLGRGLVDRAIRELEPQTYEAGDSLEVFVNQGNREAVVLGVIDDQMMVEYEMPAGTTAMLLMPNEIGGQNWGKSVSYRTCPNKWIKAIFHGTGWWSGKSQTGTEYPFPPMAK